MGEMSPQARGLLRVAGFLVWFLAGLPLFVRVVQAPELLHQTPYICWLSCYFAFGATFGLTRWDTGPQERDAFNWACLRFRPPRPW